MSTVSPAGSAHLPPGGHRVAVIGDVGGHLAQLRRELVRLGADEETGELPTDLTIVQVGDLVHRGPDSAGVVALVDRHLRGRGGQWIQLVGNHEAQYLAAPAFVWPERLDDTSADTVRGWWADGLMQVAVVVPDADDRDVLITHAGLTAGYWRQVLGAPIDAVRAAEALNALIGDHDEVIFRPGQMLTGRGPDLSAGPLWAAAASELVPSWLGAGLPFSQLHGHTTLYAWDERRFTARDEIARRTTLDETARHESTKLGAARIIGIDPGHGRVASPSWRAWQPLSSG
ncbi:MAG TPA: metallophosphoesterase [Microlunatus sp.]